MQRKHALLPSQTFDLDGDGAVSTKDYLIASIHDKDRDGVLNAEERSAALECIKSGQADLIWKSKHLSGKPLDKDAPIKIKQDKSDYDMVITEPSSPKALNRARTQAELFRKRKDNSARQNEAQYSTWVNEHNKFQEEIQARNMAAYVRTNKQVKFS